MVYVVGSIFVDTFHFTYHWQKYTKKGEKKRKREINTHHHTQCVGVNIGS